MTYEEKIGTERFDAMVADFFANRYFDRGMRKWQGYYLSDHTAVLRSNLKAKRWFIPRCPFRIKRSFAQSCYKPMQKAKQ